jgi:hypothetical protein
MICNDAILSCMDVFIFMNWQFLNCEYYSRKEVSHVVVKCHSVFVLKYMMEEDNLQLQMDMLYALFFLQH